jgi:hypothetical protein
LVAAFLAVEDKRKMQVFHASQAVVVAVAVELVAAGEGIKNG